MKKKLLAGLLLLGFAVLPVLSQAAGAKQGGAPATKFPAHRELKTITLAGQTSANFIPFWIAKNKGWFEEEFGKDGIKVKYSVFKSGPLLLESFASGEQNIGIVGDTPAIIGHTQGIKLKAIGVIGHGPRRLAIVVPSGSSIQTAHDLKGKRIATAKGSTAHELLALVLKEQGFGWNDVKVVNLQPTDAVVALKTGDVDAASIWEPTVSEAELNGIGRILLDGTGYKLGLSLIIVNTDFASKYPDLVARYLTVIKRAGDWRKNHPRETVEILARETKFSPDVLKLALPKIITDVRITGKTLADLKKTATQLRESEVIRTDADIESLVDIQYLKRARLL